MDLGALSDLEQEGRLIARVGAREIGVVDAGGGLHALRNRCPHHGGPLCLGTLRNREAGAPGRYQPSGRTVLRCPWHGWEFDLETGVCVDEPTLRAAVYETRIEDGRVLVRA